MNLTGISLFSGGGIGDLAMRAAGIDLLVANEKEEQRVKVLKSNYPEADIIAGDIESKLDEITQVSQERLKGRRLDFLLATPPCQGMSKNGMGRILNGVRRGKRPSLDPRNQLILPALTLIARLRPRVVVFENVPEMVNTVIEDRSGDLRCILDVIQSELQPLGYKGEWQVVEFADYGVPQRRKRLITVFSNETAMTEAMAGNKIFPAPTHARKPDASRKPWVTINQALEGVPPLDARDKESASSSIPYHHVNVLDPMKYLWVANTAPFQTAYDNQCVNPDCLYQHNQTHKSRINASGIHATNTDTPIKCAVCGEVLPRPHVIEDGEPRIMRGFTSHYKRMSGDLPANALTRNFAYVCSDSKIHPTQNRTLSIYEAMILHTIADYDFSWGNQNKIAEGTIRDIIGESIPPKGLQQFFDLWTQILTGDRENQPRQLDLFSCSG